MDLVQNKIPKTRWFRIIPIVFFANTVQWIDKSVISFALPGGMAKELAMSSSVSGLLGTVFSIGYLFLQIPGGSLAAKGKCKNFLALSISSCAAILYLMGAATSSKQILTYRFMLGFCEGAIIPALMTIISNWFPNEERGRANAALLSSASISQITVGPIAALLLIGHSWRFLFNFASIISIALVIIWMVFLVERPIDAKWLSEEERNYLLEKMEAEKANKKPTGKSPLLEVSKDTNLWKLCFIYLSLSLGTLGLQFWLPTMIKTITKTGMAQTAFLSAIPNGMVLIGVLSMGVISDKTQKRKFFAGFTPMIFTGLLVIAIVFKSSPWLSFGILSFACLFLQGASLNLWSMLPILLSPEKAGSARGILNTSSNVGGMIAPLMIGLMMDITGNMLMSWSLIFVFAIFGFLVSLTLPKHLNGPSEKSKSTST